MVGKRFETLTDWNVFMKGRKILVVNQNNPWRNEECDFIEMVGENEIISQQSHDKIKMKVKAPDGTILNLAGNEIMIIEKKIIQRPKQN